MTVCSLFVVIFFLCKNAPLIVKRNWKDDDASKSLNRGLMGRTLSFVYKCLKSLYYFLYEFEVIYYVAYGGLALVATLTHPFFFSLCAARILPVSVRSSPSSRRRRLALHVETSGSGNPRGCRRRLSRDVGGLIGRCQDTGGWRPGLLRGCRKNGIRQGPSPSP
jgi:hypothetical protein